MKIWIDGRYKLNCKAVGSFGSHIFTNNAVELQNIFLYVIVARFLKKFYFR